MLRLKLASTGCNIYSTQYFMLFLILTTFFYKDYLGECVISLLKRLFSNVVLPNVSHSRHQYFRQLAYIVGKPAEQNLPLGGAGITSKINGKNARS